MEDETTIAILLIGVLIYKTLELAIVRDKLRQASARGRRLTIPASISETIWARTVATLDGDFQMVTMIYLLVTGTLLGEFLILAQGQAGVAGYRDAKVISAVTILASTFLALLNITVERYRSLLETI